MSQRKNDPIMENEIIIGKNYTLGKQIGKGSFGEIYQGTDIKTKKFIAIKIEEINAKYPQLKYEYKVLKLFENIGNFNYRIEGVPQVQWFGTEANYNIMVMDLLGPDLDELLKFQERPFSIKTALLLIDQILTRIEIIHSRHYIHRDIKPQNFLFGLDKNSHILYLIDYGLCRKYRDSKTFQHVLYRENCSLAGTARYVSINAHLGILQSRRDDLESVGYMILYLLKGSLPWMKCKAKTKDEKYNKILEKKIQINPDILAKGLPCEFATYLHYCRALKFEEKPDYAYLRNLFKKLFLTLNIPYDLEYDWVLNLNINIVSQNSNITLEDKKININQIESFSLTINNKNSDGKMEEIKNIENDQNNQNNQNIVQVSNSELEKEEKNEVKDESKGNNSLSKSGEDEDYNEDNNNNNVENKNDKKNGRKEKASESQGRNNEGGEGSKNDEKYDNKEPAKKTKLIERYKEANKSKLKAFNKSKGKRFLHTTTTSKTKKEKKNTSSKPEEKKDCIIF